MLIIPPAAKTVNANTTTSNLGNNTISDKNSNNSAAASSTSGGTDTTPARTPTVRPPIPSLTVQPRTIRPPIPALTVQPGIPGKPPLSGNNPRALAVTAALGHKGPGRPNSNTPSTTPSTAVTSTATSATAPTNTMVPSGNSPVPTEKGIPETSSEDVTIKGESTLATATTGHEQPSSASSTTNTNLPNEMTTQEIDSSLFSILHPLKQTSTTALSQAQSTSQTSDTTTTSMMSPSTNSGHATTSSSNTNTNTINSTASNNNSIICRGTVEPGMFSCSKQGEIVCAVVSGVNLSLEAIIRSLESYALSRFAIQNNERYFVAKDNANKVFFP